MELDSKFEKLIKKQVSYKSNILGLNLLIARVQNRYGANPSPEELEKCLQEMRAFFEKFKSILGKDIEALKNL